MTVDLFGDHRVALFEGERFSEIENNPHYRYSFRSLLTLLSKHTVFGINLIAVDIPVSAAREPDRPETNNRIHSL